MFNLYMNNQRPQLRFSLCGYSWSKSWPILEQLGNIGRELLKPGWHSVVRSLTSHFALNPVRLSYGAVLQAIRAAGFHKHYPLMASGSDDGSVHVFHATVYSDLLRNPLIVPLKILRAHEVGNDIIFGKTNVR